VFDFPVSNPAFLKPSRAYRVTSQRCCILSGSLTIISIAARTEAADAGVMLALKISDRELCLIKLIVSLSEAINPPSEARDFEKVPITRSTLSVSPNVMQFPIHFLSTPME
jgi:hypothetical protein